MTRVSDAFAAIAAADRPEVWISLRDEAAVTADVDAQLARVANGEILPLAGLLFAVKDNIDVAGLPTTAACPGFSHDVEADATAVARLREAGAVVLGKTNLDQFATGLVGTRSPYGAVRSAVHPERISGGSSSGSAVAVALGFVDFALGTDTAGSGRVPAALQGLVGVKASVGLVPTTGVVPACRSLDCVTAFAARLDLADLVVKTMSGVDGLDALAIELPASAPLAGPAVPVIAIPRDADLGAMSPLWRSAFDAHVSRLRDAGVSVVEFDLSPFLDAAALLYNGAFVAERYAAVGAIIDAAPEGLDPVVAGIVTASGTLRAHQLASDRIRLAELRRDGEAELTRVGATAMLIPTTTHHPLLTEVAAEPVAVNSRLGTFTNFANLFGYPAYAVPIASGVEGENVGVQVLARPFEDAVVRDVAALVQRVEALDEPASLIAPVPTASGIDVLVVGAHLSGLPLHPRIRRHGALPQGVVRTAPGYTLVALGDALNRPGMIRDTSTESSVVGELWRVPPAALSDLLLEAAAPLGLGRVILEDGREVIGYLCDATATVGKTVVPNGDWRAFVTSS